MKNAFIIGLLIIGILITNYKTMASTKKTIPSNDRIVRDEGEARITTIHDILQKITVLHSDGGPANNEFYRVVDPQKLAEYLYQISK